MSKLRKKKRVNFPYRYEMVIGEEHRGRMDPDLIRWVIEHREVVENFKKMFEEEKINYTILKS